MPALVSLVGALSARSNSGVSIRFVEWLRDNGARGLVNDVESFYYSLTAPSTGGPALRALPSQPGAVTVDTAAAARRRAARLRQVATLPHAVPPVIRPSLPGEGVWRATFSGVPGSAPPVLVTSFRPDPNYPRLVAGVAWINTRRATIAYYPGQLEPAVPLPTRGRAEVPPADRSRLVATFNSAFKLKDAGGGFALGGRTYAPLHDGTATILQRHDGRIDIVSWSGGPDAGPDIRFARQNLPLIVDGGRANPNLSDGPEWGATLGNAIRVWRSGVGIDRRGGLLYAAANDQTVGSLAAILIRAGAVRAMELDINSYWTSFITYRHPGAVGARNLLADMSRSSQRYLAPDDRDFFAVLAR